MVIMRRMHWMMLVSYRITEGGETMGLNTQMNKYAKNASMFCLINMTWDGTRTRLGTRIILIDQNASPPCVF